MTRYSGYQIESWRSRFFLTLYEITVINEHIPERSIITQNSMLSHYTVMIIFSSDGHMTVTLGSCTIKLILEPEPSTPLTSKLASGGNPEPVTLTSDPYNLPA
jgi:hypothetical protein